MKIHDTASGVLLIAGSLALWVYAQRLPTMPNLPYGPGTFPSLVAIGLLVAGVVLAVSGLCQMRQRSAVVPHKGYRHWLYAASVPAAVVMYMVLAPWAGFPVAGFAVVALMVGWLYGRWLTAVLVAAGTVGLIWLVFVRLLGVPLPMGWLQ